MKQPCRLIHSFSGTLALVIFILLIISSLVLSTYWYNGEREKVNSDFLDRQNISREMLQQSVIWIDRGNFLYETVYEPGITEAMGMYLQAYNKTGGDPGRLNLTALDEEITRSLGGTWDLYLIDNGVVTNTTFPDDMGLDFKKYPQLYQTYLGYIMNGEMVIDRTVRGFAADAPFRKFAYQGTPDHKYLLEISQNFKTLRTHENKASYRELTNATVEFNPSILSIELYNSQGSVIASRSLEEIPVSDDESGMVMATFSSNNESIIRNPDQNTVISYLFLPVEDTGAPSTPMMHLVARIVYSTELQNLLYFQLTALFVAFVGITLLIAIIVALALSKHLTRPLNQIGDDVDRIASGDLNHKITRTGAVETQRIENSISQMVDNLKENIENLHFREEELQKQLTLRIKAEERYRRLFDSAHEAIFILEKGVVKDCNLEGCSLLGMKKGDILGKNILVFSKEGSYGNEMNEDGGDPSSGQEDAVSSSSDAPYHKIVSILMNENDSDGIFFTEWTFINADGTIRETEVHLNTLSLDDGLIVQMMVRDITELKEFNRRHIRAINQLEENLAQLATINDQIRNPLAIIMILAEMQGDLYEGEIVEQVRRIDKLICTVDSGFYATDKVRTYLRKYYDTGKPEKSGLGSHYRG